MSPRAQDDLGYVRDVVRRSESGSPPPSILYLWAAISAPGFAIVDFAPERAGLYWLVAGLAGFVASSWLGSRHARRIGQESDEEGRRYLLHWGGMGVAIFLLLFGASGWGSSAAESSHAILLLVGLSYWLAGVHGQPPLKWMGLIAGGSYLALAFAEGFPYPWTVTGIVLAAGLVVAGRFAGTARGEG